MFLGVVELYIIEYVFFNKFIGGVFINNLVDDILRVNIFILYVKNLVV